MITVINKTDVYEYYGLSTDTKPLNAPNASTFIEMDNQKIYSFDAQNQTWHEFIDLVGGGGGGGVPLLTRAEWEALTTAEKQSYNLVAIQDTNGGFRRGELVYGADYMNIELLQSGTAKNAVTVDTANTGHYKLLVLAINSEASSYELTITASLNGNTLTAETSEVNNYVGTGNNQRNYRLNVYDLNTVAGDALEITLATNNNYSSFVYGIIASSAWTFGKALTTHDAVTSGSYTVPGMVVYGTFAGGNGGTISVAQYSPGTTITTDDPGSGYRSSYIFWFE